MNLRELNHKRNIAMRRLKAKVGKFLFDYKNKNRFTPSKLKEIKKILFLRNDNKIGDMIVNTLAFREIKKQLPKAQISVIAGPDSAKIIENNRNISHIFIYKKGLMNILKLGLSLRRQNFDLYIDMDRQNTFESILLLRLVKPRFAFGFNRDNFKAYNIKANIDFDAVHITAWHKAMLKALRLQETDISYDLFVPNSLKKEALKFLSKLPKNKGNIALNAFASSSHRCLSLAQIRGIAQELNNYNIILIGHREKAEIMQNVIDEKNLFITPQDNIFMSFAIIAVSDLLITPDTSFVHAAAALDKKQICIYKESDKPNQRIWAPLSGKALIIQAPDEFSYLPVKEITQAALKLI